METIKINDIVKKDSGLGIVTFNNGMQATTAVWQQQELDYLIHDVGIGGTVSVEIKVNENKKNPAKPYTNITKVDMKSAVKGEIPMDATINASQIKFDKPTDDRDAKITAAVILKGAVELLKGSIKEGMSVEEIGRGLADGVNELTGAYKLALSNVKGL